MESAGNVECTIVTELLNLSGQLKKRVNFGQTSVSLGRNQCKELILRIGSTESIVMKNIKVFKKFMKEGKSTIQLPSLNKNIYISNCPPHKLSSLIKVLIIKQSAQENTVSDRGKLLSSKGNTLQEISPLTVHDIKLYKVKNSVPINSPVLKGTNSSKTCELTPVRATKRHSTCNHEEPYQKKIPSSKYNSVPSVTQSSTFKTPNKQEFSTKIVKGDSGKKVKVVDRLTEQQREVLNAVLEGSNIFFTGSAGTGKSYLLKQIIGSLPPEKTVATASTGVAACQIGAITLHSFAGIGSGSESIEKCIELAKRPRVAQNWKKCKTLIIDEISMVDSEFFEKLEEVARVIRGNDKPFGGIQLILSGDFLQLPPVNAKYDDRKFCFQSQKWQECISVSFELTQVKRQKDKDFISILHYIRVGKCPDAVFNRLMETRDKTIENNGIIATQLCTHKDSVEQINNEKMLELKSETKVFVSNDSDSSYTEQMDKNLLVPAKLELKVGAQVMLAKNLDVQSGLVNGARGVVVKFQMDKTGLPIVRFTAGMQLPIKQEKFVLKTIGGIATRRQLPLKLAWAISIHKSQGLTLDCCKVSLSRVFEHGQAYVALSRAKSLEGLQVLDMTKGCVKAHPEVLKFYINLRREMRKNEEYHNLGVKSLE